jgi:succinoglycan biosynthesis protein ExoA
MRATSTPSLCTTGIRQRLRRLAAVFAEGWPSVSIVLPARNCASALADAVQSALCQDYDGQLELVIAVAPSTDATEQVAKELAATDARVMVVANPAAEISAGLNAAIDAACGEVVARIDGQARFDAGYLRQAVTSLRTSGAANVGGIQLAVGSTPFEDAVATAMQSRFGVGGASFRRGTEPGPVDTVYLGVFDRAALDSVGGYDETLLRNEDYELNWRLREAGHTVWLDPELIVEYRPRGSLRALARQFHDYGRWKREVLRRHPKSLKTRQLAPPVVVAGLGASVLAAPVSLVPFALVAGGYGAGIAAVAAIESSGDPRQAARLLTILPTMHLSWGAGFFRGPGRASALR